MTYSLTVLTVLMQTECKLPPNVFPAVCAYLNCAPFISVSDLTGIFFIPSLILARRTDQGL